MFCDIICIFFYSHSLKIYVTEYKQSALQVRISEENIIKQQFITAKI